MVAQGDHVLCAVKWMRRGYSANGSRYRTRSCVSKLWASATLKACPKVSRVDTIRSYRDGVQDDVAELRMLAPGSRA